MGTQAETAAQSWGIRAAITSDMCPPPEDSRQVDPRCVDSSMLLGVAYRVEHVLHRQFRGAGIGFVVHTAKIGGHHRPFSLLGMGKVSQSSLVTATPCVEGDQQRYGRALLVGCSPFGHIENHFLRRAVFGACDDNRVLIQFLLGKPFRLFLAGTCWRRSLLFLAVLRRGDGTGRGGNKERHDQVEGT